MKLENEFTVPAGIADAWSVLLDVERVAPCLPGAVVEPLAGDEGEYNGTMTVKIGPITARYKGTVRVLEADEANRRAVMRAQAKDARGQGTAAATITSTMQEVPDGTRVQVVTDMRVTGPAAQFGRGVMQDVSAKMMRQFADCLAQEMSGGGEPAPAGAVSGAPSGGPAAAGEPAAAGTAADLPVAPAAEALAAAAAPEATTAGAVSDAPSGGPAAGGEPAAAGMAGTAPDLPVTPAAEALASAAGPEATAAGGEAAAQGAAGGDAPAEAAAAGGPATAGGQGAGGGPTAPPRPRPTPEVLDLADASREAVLKRAAPVVGAALLLIILLRLIRRG